MAAIPIPMPSDPAGPGLPPGATLAAARAAARAPGIGSANPRGAHGLPQGAGVTAAKNAILVHAAALATDAYATGRMALAGSIASGNALPANSQVVVKVLTPEAIALMLGDNPDVRITATTLGLFKAHLVYKWEDPETGIVWLMYFGASEVCSRVAQRPPLPPRDAQPRCQAATERVAARATNTS